MDILLIGAILFIAYQLRPQKIETEEEKKKKKEQQEVQNLCEDISFGYYKRKYPDDEEVKLKERVSQSLKKF
jgi:tRNA C32,U32 (ribose-2'-O)-methylase TrmJ